MDTKPSQIKPLCDNLKTQAWSITHTLFSEKLLNAMRLEAHAHEKANDLSVTQVRNIADHSISPRGDLTLWLDDARCGFASEEFLQALNCLRIILNEQLMLGLTSVDAHFALYPAGASYSRHRDNFRDKNVRVLSLVCYLNHQWPEDAGGRLRLHLCEGNNDVIPEKGTVVMFLSDEIEHEVLPSTQSRYSIAAWFNQRELSIR